jgi:hypothetical protein
MEESISGFKTRGDWGDVVEHGERITRALREVGVTDDSHDASDDGADGTTDADAEPEEGADGTADADTAATGETTDTPETADASETVDASETADASETVDTPETTDAPETAGAPEATDSGHETGPDNESGATADDESRVTADDESGATADDELGATVDDDETGDTVVDGDTVVNGDTAVDSDGETDYTDAFEEWDEWRPKAHERLGEDVEEKTAEQASVAEGEGEKAGEKPGDDLRTAGEKLSESYEQVEAGDDEGALKRWQDSIDHVVRAADSAGRQAVRSVEDTVYRRVMTQLAPYYFDNELVSANIQKTTRGEEDGPAFVFEVNVNDDAVKEAVSDRLAEYEDEVDRWHVDTQKAVESVEAAEGVEPPADTVDNDDGTSGQSRSTTN